MLSEGWRILVVPPPIMRPAGILTAQGPSRREVKGDISVLENTQIPDSASLV